MYKKRGELACLLHHMPEDARRLHPPYPATKYVNEFFGMTLGERAHIVRLGRLKTFKPDTPQPSAAFKEKYSQDWWNKNVCFTDEGLPRNGDTCSFITAVCLFKERVQPEWKPPVIEPIDFYAAITPANALAWYEACPPHLRTKLEKEMEKFPEAESATSRSDIYKQVRCLWGDLPQKVFYPEFNDRDFATSEEYDIFDEWVHEYDRQVAIEVILTHGPAIQQERRMLNEAMGVSSNPTMDLNGFPMQSDGLDETQAATIRWLQHQGQTPLEFLADTYKNSDAKLGDRITAARTLMEYIHRKVPQKTELETKDITAPKLDPKTLKGLSEKDLELLEKLLNKLGGSN